ncbi:ATP-binding cassette sub-family B member 10, mitochondrial [Platysternon megacephalum]|uniref:ATP-binding cassette sub-family B member 10, mitochondrial n=1 Tax=Platysternon megacephalum TaxID=55544 RepID=A0A4D9EJM2_9SAUR|nr:ATP-binding cassette sub-family B member 10, mitochondrial [Platysternon megacephalum]
MLRASSLFRLITHYLKSCSILNFELMSEPDRTDPLLPTCVILRQLAWVAVAMSHFHRHSHYGWKITDSTPWSLPLCPKGANSFSRAVKVQEGEKKKMGTLFK